MKIMETDLFDQPIAERTSRTCRNPVHRKVSYNAYYHRHREKISDDRKTRYDPVKGRAKSLKRLCGISLELWHKAFANQSGKCAICLTSEFSKSGPHTDHDHATGLFRGILCQRCNHMLGGARDNTSILWAAIKYLNKGNQQKTSKSKK